MADQRIVDYLRQNMGNYPLESLKAACINQGFSTAAVEEAAAALQQTVPPPPPEQPSAPVEPSYDGQPEQPLEDFVDFKPKNLFSNAFAMARAPEAFFNRIHPETGLGHAALTGVLWAILCVPLAGMAAFAKAGLIGGLFSMVGAVFMLPLGTLIMSFIGAGIFHFICSAMGGGSSFKGSYASVAAMTALMPLSTLLGILPYAGAVLPQLAGCYLTVNAAAGLHRIPKQKALIAFGILTAFWIYIGWAANMAAQRLQKSLSNFSVETTSQTGGGWGATMGAGQDARSASPGMDMAPKSARQAMDMATNMMKAMGDEQANQDFQQRMKQVQQDPLSVVREMQRFQEMKYPPNETLLLLDTKSSDLLVTQWPHLSGPIRQTIVQSLPSLPKEERADSLAEMIEASKNVNELLGESMKMLNGVLPPQGGPPQER